MERAGQRIKSDGVNPDLRVPIRTLVLWIEAP